MNDTKLICNPKSWQLFPHVSNHNQSPPSPSSTMSFIFDNILSFGEISNNTSYWGAKLTKKFTYPYLDTTKTQYQISWAFFTTTDHDPPTCLNQINTDYKCSMWDSQTHNSKIEVLKEFGHTTEICSWERGILWKKSGQTALQSLRIYPHIYHSPVIISQKLALVF